MVNKTIIALFVYVISCLPHLLKAQDGDYYLTHHNPPPGLIDNLNFDIEQDQNGLIWIANRKGVVLYDGARWSLIPTESAIFQIAQSSENVIYAGGRDVMGRVTRDVNNRFKFQTIHQDSLIGDIVSILEFKDEIFYLAESNLIVFNKTDSSVSKINSGDAVGMSDLFIHDQNILITTSDDEVYTYENGELYTADSTWTEINPLWISSNEEGSSIVVSSQGVLYLDNGDGFELLSLDEEDSLYLDASLPLKSIWVTSNLVAVSTLSGGVVFIDVDKKEISEIVNYHTGLPDNQVFTIALDFDKGVWVSHDYGFTRIAPLMPFRSYKNFDGLEGSIITAAHVNEKLYVGTNLGTYVLDRIENYEETEVFVKTQVQKPASQSETPEEDAKGKKKKNRKGLFGFLKKKQAPQPEQAPQTVDEWQRKIRRDLLSVRYEFRKIEEIPSKTDKLLPVDDVIVSAGLSGAFIIDDTEVETITTRPVREIYYSVESDILFVSTYDNEILSYQHEGEAWIETDLLDGLNDVVFQITEIDESVWLCSADSLYRIELDDTELVDVDVFHISNPYFEETYAVQNEGKLYFVNSSGYYFYDQSNRTVEFDSLFYKSLGAPQRMFVEHSGNLWIRTETSWEVMGTLDYENTNFDFLNVFPDIKYLSYSKTKDVFWLITEQNQIYEIKPPDKEVLFSQNSIYLREIRKQNNLLNPASKLQVELEGSALTFSFIQPEYSGLLGIQYQYKLAGLTNQWSEWNESNNIFSFNFLPPGSYALEFRTRNVIGEEKSISPLEFKVIAPYWRRPWFYAIEVFFFGSLLFLSFRLNTGKRKYSVISRLLAFLTLILVVEFVQTVAENTLETEISPVIDFFVQVTIALFVLPVESVLRNRLIKSADPPSPESKKKK